LITPRIGWKARPRKWPIAPVAYGPTLTKFSDDMSHQLKTKMNTSTLKDAEAKSAPSDLLPCPFCAGQYIADHPNMKGSRPAISQPKLEELTVGGWRVTCYGCGVGTWNTLKYTREEAIAAWNTRRGLIPTVQIQPTEDTKRLNWLIEHGFTPAKWRPWMPGDPESKNGMTFCSNGGREEIDVAMNQPPV
jgi:hypothetical protein